MRRIPGLRIVQCGDEEANFRFDPALLDTVCDAIDARRRRVMTPEQRMKSTAHLKTHQFSRR
jgi:hypothetical protein